MSHEKSVNVQDAFLNHIRKNKTPLTVFLVNGVKLQGTITWFDSNTILLRQDFSGSKTRVLSDRT